MSAGRRLHVVEAIAELRVSRAYRKSHTPPQPPSVLSGGMDHRASRPAPARRTGTAALVSLAILGVAIAAFGVQRSLAASAQSSSSVEVGPPIAPQAPPGEADGVIPDGVAVSVFDDEIPAFGRLDPDLLDALRRAATDAEADSVGLRVNSGWRSPEYQQQLLQDAVVEYGSQEEASRWVATP